MTPLPQTPVDFSTTQEAALFLKNFQAAVSGLCSAVDRGDAVDAQSERLFVQGLIAKVGTAIDMLSTPQPAARICQAPGPSHLVENVPLALDNTLSFDKLEVIMSKLSKEAAADGVCPITAAVYRAFYSKDSLPAVTQVSSPEASRARMLRLAQYMVHQYAPAYLMAAGLEKDARNLSSVPSLQERDDLPRAVARLRELREEAAKYYVSSYACLNHQSALLAVTSLYRWMTAVLDELDGFVPDVGKVMARLIWVLRLGAEYKDKSAIDAALADV